MAQRYSGPMVARIAIAVALVVAALAMAIYLRHRRDRFVPFVPTEPEVVDVMLTMAELRSTDVVYDLGCGDGRIVIKAIQSGAARGVCVDIDLQRMAGAFVRAQSAGVVDRFKFIVADAREVDLTGATVVFLYLSTPLNLELRPRLRALPPGTRIVSHWHDMGDWTPETVQTVDGSWFGTRNVYRWTVR
jgi:SAM-dependent methyltransferase